uniref:Uncharacterized protein n=1 Tax=Arundo donax TaxID=35708 RepID=A0A0A9C5R8_ARUDO
MECHTKAAGTRCSMKRRLWKWHQQSTC